MLNYGAKGVISFNYPFGVEFLKDYLGRTITKDRVDKVLQEKNYGHIGNFKVSIAHCTEGVVVEMCRKLGEVVMIESNACLVFTDICIYLVLAFRFGEKFSVSVNYYYDAERASREDIFNTFTKVFGGMILDNSLYCPFDWYAVRGGQLTVVQLQEELDDVLYDESYPSIGGIESYVHNYIQSPENVLVIKGLPGTGKTRFVRYILRELYRQLGISRDEEYFAMYCVDAAAVEEGSLFVDFISYDYTALVLEDLDYHISARDTGNTVMYKLLNFSDGVIKNFRKKIILTTNIVSASGIDPALLRPGRCYDVLSLRNLSLEESEVLLSRMGSDVQLPAGQESFSLADVYRLVEGKELLLEGLKDTRTVKKVKTKVGFGV